MASRRIQEFKQAIVIQVRVAACRRAATQHMGEKVIIRRSQQGLPSWLAKCWLLPLPNPFFLPCTCNKTGQVRGLLSTDTW